MCRAMENDTSLDFEKMHALVPTTGTIDPDHVHDDVLCKIGNTPTGKNIFLAQSPLSRCSYADLIIGDIKTPDYHLLCAAENQGSSAFRQALADGASLRVVDPRIPGRYYRFFDSATHQEIAFSDLLAVSEVSIKYNNRLMVAVHPYTTRYNRDVVDYAHSLLNVGILRVIHEKDPEFLQEKGIDFCALTLAFDQERESIKRAQKAGEIPTFSEQPLESVVQKCSNPHHPDSRHSSVHAVMSDYDDYRFYLKPCSQDGHVLYEYPHDQEQQKPDFLEIDLLAHIYCSVIARHNGKSGDVVGAWNAWSKYPFLTKLVARFLATYVKRETFFPHYLLPDPLVVMGKKFLSLVPQDQQKQDFFADNFLALLVCLGAQKVHSSDKAEAQEWLLAYAHHVENLMATEHGKWLLQKICKDNQEALFAKKIQPYMENVERKRHYYFLLKQMLGKDISNLIVSEL